MPWIEVERHRLCLPLRQQRCLRSFGLAELECLSTEQYGMPPLPREVLVEHTFVFRHLNTSSFRGTPSPIVSCRSSVNCFAAQARSATSRGAIGAGGLFTAS